MGNCPCARQHNDDNTLKLKTRTNRLEQYLYDYIHFLVDNEQKKTCLLSDYLLLIIGFWLRFIWGIIYRARKKGLYVV